MTIGALACETCGAGLPPPDASGTSSCVYCGTEHKDRSSGVLATMQAGGSYPAPPLSGIIVDPSTWQDSEDAARIPMTEESVLDLLRQHFGDGIESVFVCPHVPPKKERAARRAHASHLPAHERILALHDATLLGGGDEGFVVTVRRLCWKNPGQPARSIEWQDLAPDSLFVDGSRVWVDGDAIVIREDAVLDACANAFFVLALSGLPPRPKRSTHVRTHDGRKVALETTPPAHTTSYRAYVAHAETNAPDRACWHCKTPLYESTPQCAFCGALPKKKGWLQTG